MNIRIKALFTFIITAIFFAAAAFADEPVSDSSANGAYPVSDIANNGNIILAGFGKEDNYYPDVKVTYAFANTPFSEAITTEEKLLLDKPFYILIEASVKVPGLWRQIFGVKSVLCGVSFRSPQIVRVSSVETTVDIHQEENLKPHIVYSFPIPVTPDGQQKVRVVFYCDPVTTGQQELRLAFDNNVASMYKHTYVFSIKGKGK
jgi:hypothetical protein